MTFTRHRSCPIAVYVVAMWLCSMLAARALGQDARRERITDVNGNMHDALLRGDYDRAIRLGHELVELAPGRVTPMYNLACAYAGKGNENEAIAWLEKAARHGFALLATFQRDEDLDSIRNHPRFADVAALIEKNNAEALERFKRKAENATVLTFLPNGKEMVEPAPLIVALHGYGSNALDIASIWKEVAAEAGAVLIAPQAVTRADSGFSWDVIENAQYLVSHAIDGAQKDHNIDMHRIVLTGFSQGGSMALLMGLRFPERFAGVIPMSAYYDHRLTPIPEARTPELPRFFIMNGAEDEETANNREAARRLQARGTAVEIRIYEGVGHALPPDHADELRDALRFVLATNE